MKKLFTFLAIICVAILCFSSCKKCYTCDFGSNGGQQKYCPSDFPDRHLKGKRDLKMTIDAFEANGYPCVAD